MRKTRNVGNNIYSSGAFLSTAAQNTERHWMPYSVDVGVVYYRIVGNFLKNKMAHIGTPAGILYY